MDADQTKFREFADQFLRDYNVRTMNVDLATQSDGSVDLITSGVISPLQPQSWSVETSPNP